MSRRLQSDSWIMQPVVNLGVHKRGDPVRGYGNTIYFTSAVAPYPMGFYNLSENTFGSYSNLRDDAYFASSVQIAFSYGICNGAMYNGTGMVDPHIPTSYYELCDGVNGYEKLFFKNDFLFDSIIRHNSFF